MNILYLHSHDTGRYIQPYGFAVETPNLQAFAEQGIVFRDAHCAAPTCSPSRAALLTGQTAHEAGMIALAHRGGKLVHPERHLAHVLAQQGFKTCKAGISHVGTQHDQHGYQEFYPKENPSGEDVVKNAQSFLERQNSSTPFFLDAGFIDTHRAGSAQPMGFSSSRHSPGDRDGNPDYTRPPAVLADNKETRRDWLDYCHSVERLDGYYGEILDTLEASGLGEDTLVVITTDHGLPFPGMKCSLTHHGTGVLWLLRLPNGEASGTVIDAQVSHLDLYPTVCDLLELEPPPWLEGRSLLPLIHGETDTLHETLFAEVTFHAAFEPKRSARTARWNYIRNVGPPRSTVMPNCDDGLSKQFEMRYGMAEQPVPQEELYDLVFDPQERNNRANDPACKEILEDLRTRLDAWMRETDDILLNPEPPSATLIVNPPSCVQPDKKTSKEWDPTEWETVHPEASDPA